MQRVHLLDHDRLPRRSQGPEQVDLLLDLQFPGIQVQAEKIQRSAGFCRIRPQREPVGDFEEEEHPAADEPRGVLAADAGDQGLHPLPRDLGARPARRIPGEALDIVQSAEIAAEQVVGGLRRTQRLIHQGVAEDRGARSAGLCHGLPEAGLHRPPVLFRRVQIPEGSVLLPIAAQAGQIEVQTQAFREVEQPGKPGEGFLIRQLRGLHEAAELQVHADDRAAERLDFAKVPGDPVPLEVPVFLEQVQARIAVVVDAPRHPGLARGMSDEAAATGRDGDALRAGPGFGGRGAAREQDQEAGQPSAHGFRTKVDTLSGGSSRLIAAGSFEA